MQLDIEALNRTFHGARSDRYILVEVTGRPGGKYGGDSFVQRPTAEKHAERGGYGLYDRRKQVLLSEPNAQKRLDHLSVAVSIAEDRLAKATTLLNNSVDAVARTEEESKPGYEPPPDRPLRVRGRKLVDAAGRPV